MKTLTRSAFDRAKSFLMEQARPLERRLFEHHFELDGDSQAAVIDELARYQNPDGGFGNALEPDVRMPDSSVVATKFALQILLDVQASVQQRLVQDGVAYLLEQFDAERKAWPLVTAAVMDAPHAPWWDYDGLEQEFDEFRVNPKASVLRCLLAYAELVSQRFLDGVLESLLEYLRLAPSEMAFFDIVAGLQLLQAPRLDPATREWLRDKLLESGRTIVNPDPGEWHQFAIKPLWLAPSPHAPLAETLGDVLQTNLDFEIEQQNADGSWSPTWSWETADPEHWQLAEREWQGILTLAMLRSLRDFGRIDGCRPVDSSVFKYHID